jgi:TRAP-type uncharacterized transport system fused permease subunit
MRDFWVFVAAFASAIEGWLFTRMDSLSRVVVLPAIVGLFWPDFRIEALGAAVIAGVFALNWLAARRAGPRPA